MDKAPVPPNSFRPEVDLILSTYLVFVSADYELFCFLEKSIGFKGACQSSCQRCRSICHDW